MADKTKIDWSLNAQITGGPKIGFSKSMEVEAYDVVSVTLPARPPKAPPNPLPDPPPPPDPGDAEPVELQIQPGGGAKQVKFLAIMSDAYDLALSYKVNNAGTEITLDQMHIFMGEGAVGILGKPPKSLTFTNNIWDPTGHKGRTVSIQIIAGRDATPKADLD